MVPRNSKLVNSICARRFPRDYSGQLGLRRDHLTGNVNHGVHSTSQRAHLSLFLFLSTSLSLSLSLILFLSVSSLFLFLSTSLSLLLFLSVSLFFSFSHPPSLIRRCHPYARKSASQAVLGRMKPTLPASRCENTSRGCHSPETSHEVSRLVLATSSWSVKPNVLRPATVGMQEYR